MAFGRPREHDREKIAKDLITWAKKDSSINLNEFCALNSIVPPKIALWAKEDDYFRSAYEEAKAYIGYRREQKLNSGELHVKAYDLNANTYDYFLKKERRDQLEYEAKLKTQQEEATAETLADIIQKAKDGLLTQPDEPDGD